MRHRPLQRWIGRVAAVLVAATVLVPTLPASADDTEPTVSWVSTGDSYSSGQGLPSSGGPCEQFNPDAYGPKARLTLIDSGWTISDFAFTACTGHMAEDLFVRRSDDKGSLWEWSLEQGVSDRVDVITLSFGGNDIGFADIIKNCLVIEADSWIKTVVTTTASLFNCDLSLDELKARGNALLDPPITGCTGGRGDAHLVKGEDRYNCDLWIADNGPQLRGSIADFYRYIVDEHLTDNGKLFVAGYPSLFAPSTEWSRWNWLACKGVTKGDAEKLAAAATELDSILKAAVDRADNGEGRIIYLSNYDIYREGSHELCGTGQDWLNGIAIERNDSFHPNAYGYQGTAEHLTTALQGIDWPHAAEGPIETSTPLTMEGVGPVRIGMTLEEVEAATGQVAEYDYFDGNCFYAGIADVEGIYFLMSGEDADSSPFEGTVQSVNSYDTQSVTDTGIGVGDSEEELLRLLGDRLAASPHEYDLNGTYYDLASDDTFAEPRIMRFEVTGGIVSKIATGYENWATLVEGCS